MPIQRVFAVGLWLCVTAAATAIVWAGTSSVAANLTDRPAPVVAHGDVVTELASGSPAADTAPGITTPTTSLSPSAAPADDGGSTSPAPDSQTTAPARSQPVAPGGATTPSPGTPAVAPPVTTPNSPPTTLAPGRPTATYPTPGGVVTVACSGFFIDLVLRRASPAPVGAHP